MSGQEVMTTELAKKVRDHELALGRWRRERRIELRGAWLLAALTPLTWLLSWYVSALSGPVNQASWFTYFTFFTFVAATALTVGLGVLIFRLVLISESPAKDFVQERVVGSVEEAECAQAQENNAAVRDNRGYGVPVL